MTSLPKRRRLLICAVGLSLAVSAVVVGQENPPAKSTEAVLPANGFSIVSGRAVYEDTGAPATRYRIHLISQEVLSKPQASHRIPTAATNENGQFALRRVPAGEYFVVTGSFDDHSRGAQEIFPLPTGDSAADAERLKQFTRNHEKISIDGQHNRELNLRVRNPHFGVLSGRVLDSSRKPVARALVRLISRDEKVAGVSVRTDEKGQYKFFGLAPAEYTLCASPPAPERDQKEPATRFEGLLGVTYFPSTLDPGNSPPVTVIADRTTENIDVTLIEGNLHSIAGTIVTRGDQRPVSNAIIRLNPKNTSSKNAVYISSTNKEGKWLIANLIDGDYHLHIEPRPTEPNSERFVQEELDVTVNGADVQGLSIEVSAGTRISGTVTFEGEAPQSIRIGAVRAKPYGSSFIQVAEGGPFVLSGVPTGEVYLNASALPQERFYVKSIEVNSQDLLRTDLNIAEGTEIKAVNIVVSSAVGVVKGRVLSSDGQPVAKINVMLRRRVGDEERRLFGGQLVTTTDHQGNFVLSAAPGGVYLVVAWRTSDSPQAKAATVDRAMREQPGGITLTANEKKEIEIRLP